MIKENKVAVVFGLFETGLGVIRSLGRQGIKVYGVDFKKDIAYYSKYCNGIIGPNPTNNEREFVEWIIEKFSGYNEKIPVFITGDDYLLVFSNNRDKLNEKFAFNIPSKNAIDNLSDKFTQYSIAKETGINVPNTWLVNDLNDLKIIQSNVNWPLFVKGREVNSWRKVFGGSVKGFKVDNYKELSEQLNETIKQSVPVIVQEIIVGPDTNHFKYCAYIDNKGEILAEITLQKIRQYPIKFGVGSAVKTVDNKDLLDSGRKLFSGINFTGVGSAEFKYDKKDGKLKLIELNPRYWQQNAIGEFSGVNFALINFNDLNCKQQNIKSEFKKNYIWINRYMDFSSFLKYYRAGEIGFLSWRKSLKGKKVYSDFSWDDPIPILYEFGFGLKILRLPIFLWKLIRS